MCVRQACLHIVPDDDDVLRRHHCQYRPIDTRGSVLCGLLRT